MVVGCGEGPQKDYTTVKEHEANDPKEAISCFWVEYPLHF